jgi:hypothetical protein
LIARAAALSRKQELEQAKLRLKIMEEELEIKTEIEISDGKAKALEELEDRELIDLGLEDRDDHEHSHSKRPEAKETVTLNPCAPPWEDQRSYNQAYTFQRRTPDPSPRYNVGDDYDAYVSAPPRLNESYNAYCDPQNLPLYTTSPTQMPNYFRLHASSINRKPKSKISKEIQWITRDS